MPFKIYNTMKRKKEIFKGRGVVNIYTCGPTVYNYAHIGNFRAYLFYDLLKRWLTYKGMHVRHVMNITDIEDKIIRDSRKEKMHWREFTQKYATAFFEDLEKLRIKRADVYPRATEHIQDIVEMVTRLMLRGYAYRGEDGSIYFNIKKFRSYGKLSKLKLKKLKPGARVSHDEYGKEDASDFALWKAWTPDDGDVFWNTSLGKGRPGWHIECSAMSMKYLKTIDLHGGGVDLIFPHHENEIAQSEASTGKKFVNYWVHCAHLMVNGKKMSKSLGNFYTLRDIIEKNHDPVAFRYMAMSSHYRSQLNFTLESLENAKKTVDNFNDFLQRIRRMQNEVRALPNHRLHVAIRNTREKFEKYIDDDLNTPQALAEVFNLIKAVNVALEKKSADKRSLQAVEKFLMQVDQILDIIEEPRDDIYEEDKQLIEKREQFRKEKKFGEADQIRNLLLSRGIILEDTPTGVRWKRAGKYDQK